MKNKLLFLKTGSGCYGNWCLWKQTTKRTAELQGRVRLRADQSNHVADGLEGKWFPRLVDQGRLMATLSELATVCLLPTRYPKGYVRILQRKRGPFWVHVQNSNTFRWLYT